MANLGTAGNDVIIGNAFSETLSGLEGDDQLSGLGGDDRLDGGAGNDVLDGGDGVDTAYYLTATAGVTVDLTIGGPQATGGSGSDTLIGIENLTGSNFDDRLTGDGGANVLLGFSGNDTLAGGGGDDTLRGGLGDDLLDGGAGFDFADYSDATAGVTVSLAVSGPQNTGERGVDTLSNIEGLIGSGFADTLTGDGGANKILGGYGNDTLRGGGGDDILDGGPGDNLLDGGDGFDTADYSQGFGTVIVDLSLTTPQVGRDTLVSIERVIGGVGNDVLKAGAAGVTLLGGSGADSLYSGAGDDVLDGGVGDDAFYLGAGADTVIGGAGTDTIHVVAGAQALNIDLGALWTNGQYASGGLTITGVELIGSVTGGDMADTVTVGEGYKLTTTMSGGAGDDRLTGGGGADQIFGDAGDDILQGGGGADRLTGGAGADTLNGGAGDDILIIDAGDRAVDGGAGVDTLTFEWGTTRYATQALDIDLTNLWTGGAGLVNGAEIRGVEKIDTFFGSQLADHIVFGTGPADYSTRLSVSLGDGDDYAVGGSNGDNLDGGAGNDTLFGGDGGDALSGGDGVDRLYGGNGDDTFYAGSNDAIDGGAGRDVVRFAADVSVPAWNIDLRGLWAGGTGTINGGAIVNVEDMYDIIGTSGVDTIIIGDGLVTQITHNPYEELGREAFNGLILRGYSGDDVIVGSGGADKIYGDQGADKISGGGGDDLIVFDGKDTVDGGAGVDTLMLGDDYHRSGEALELDLRGNWDGMAGASIVNIEKFFGGNGSDYDDHIVVGDKYVLNGVQINAGSGNDIVVGGGANDILAGSYGDDQLSGGAGDDQLSGSIGNDILDGGAGNDTAIFDGNVADFSWTTNPDGSLTLRDLRDPVAYAYAYNGVDTLRNIEVLRFSDRSITLSSKAGLTIVGTVGVDQLTGGDFDDVLSGVAGDDVLTGGLGDDTLDGGDGVDIASYANALGPVTVQLRLAGQQQNTGAGLDKLISIEGVIGSAFADHLNGGSGDDVLKGGGGDDTLYGDWGNDTIDGGDGQDTAEYSGLSTSYSWTQALDGSWTITDLSSGSLSGTDTLRNVELLKFGDKIVNLPNATGVIMGTDGVDYLTGTAGNDIIRAGAGADVITSSAGDDTYDGGSGNDYVFFSDATHAITIDLAISGPQDTGVGRDTFIGVESIGGTRYSDTLRGDDGYNDLQGYGGDDVIEGRGGDDNLGGFDGNDIVRGGAGNDLISGGAGDDQLYGDAGADTFVVTGGVGSEQMGDDLVDGGDGVDTLWAAFLGVGVTVDLGRTDRQQIAADSWVTIKNVENLQGSDSADHLTGNAGDNVLMGWNGNDVIDGKGGVDTVVLRGLLKDYTISWTLDGWTISDQRTPNPSSGADFDGVDTVRNVEYALFKDQAIALGDGMSFASGLLLRSTTGQAAPLIADLSARLASNAITTPQALKEIVAAAGATTSVATLAYEFFTGKIPGQPGVDYLVSPTGPNANNLNSAYYQSFNLENRYINFAVNLGKLGEGKDAFAAKYGTLTLFDATREAYKAIFGAAPTDTKIHAMIDDRASYFATYGGDGANGIGTKAAMVGWLLAEAQKADLGVMVKSNDAWLTDLSDGSAPFAIDILDPAKGYYKADFVFGGQ